ncbi:restriction endonuclease subunit S [Sphingobium yanoikuyae]|uniref:restriction endonuclease subunit S n=1 Tax=Sphingobium yanoikuyae TaxID=13690 RepID=UPI0008475A5B|nr:restriction endonuclease subunit S [Sphingobium yanoikuyae]
MNAEQLLAHYERMAEAPDAIARLRRFVLDLAVRGKLVGQEASDEPTAQLIEAIATQKGNFGRPAHVEALPTVDEPFPCPAGWLWSTVGEICTKTGSGSTPRGGKDAYQTNGIPFLRSQNVYDDGLLLDDVAYIAPETHTRMAGTAVRPSDLLLNITGGSMGRCCRVEADFHEANVSQHVAIIRPALADMSAFLHMVVLSPYFQGFVFGEQTGAGRGGLPKNKMDQIPVPLPPLAEQHRIVAKVDELMALCDRLEEARKEREAARDCLTAASLTRLNAPDPDPATFTTHARFALDNLPALTTRADQIKQLRQTILNLAVRGKLVKQDPSELPAKAFWKSRLGAEVEQASQQGEVPFECPTGWCWTTVQQTLAMHREISYGVIKLGDEPKVGGISTLRCSDVRPGLIELSGVRKVREEIEADYSRTRLRGGEIVINIRGTLGGVALVPDTLAGFNVAREVAVVPIAPEISGSFMVYTMLSPFFWDYIQSNLRGIAYKGLNLGILRNLPIPFPPLAEQSRIVAKVDELMALCDRLESSLTTGDNTRQRLLEAILHEALEPTEARELEPA